MSMINAHTQSHASLKFSGKGGLKGKPGNNALNDQLPEAIRYAHRQLGQPLEKNPEHFKAIQRYIHDALHDTLRRGEKLGFKDLVQFVCHHYFGQGLPVR